MTLTLERKHILIAVLVLLSIIAIIYFSWPAQRPDNTQQIVNDTKKALEVQYKKQLDAKDAQMKDVQSRLFVSEQKYRVIAQKIKDLQKVKEDVKPPQTNDELRSRFTAVGFPPVSIQ